MAGENVEAIALDTTGSSVVPVGAGIIDFPALVAELEKTGYAGLYAVELDFLDPRYGEEDAAVKASISYLKKLQKSWPRRA